MINIKRFEELMENFFELGRYNDMCDSICNNIDIEHNIIDNQNKFNFKNNNKNLDTSDKFEKSDKKFELMNEEVFNQYNMKNAEKISKNKNELENLIKQFNNAFSELDGLLEKDFVSLNIK